LVDDMFGTADERSDAAPRSPHRLPLHRALRGDPTQWNPSFSGVLVFGVNNAMVFRRAGQYVARILSGETPAAMPVEVPTHFHLIVNLKTAREQGLTIPQSVLSRATRVIE
jgi:hypothetical protein